MSDFQKKDSSAADVATGQGVGAGLCGAASTIPGHHPGALAALASSAGRAEGLVGAGAGAGGAEEESRLLAPRPADGSDAGLCATCARAEPVRMKQVALNDGACQGGPHTRYEVFGNALGCDSTTKDISAPATPEGDAISREPGDTVWHSSDGESGPDVGISVFLANGDCLYAGELPHEASITWGIALYPADGDRIDIAHRADPEASREMIEAISQAIRSLPPQDGEREQIERLTAERDAIAAAAFEAAAQWLIRAGMAGDAPDDPLASCIRALTPADAKAALDAMIEAAAMTECAAFSAGYEAGERDGKSAALTAQPVALPTCLHLTADMAERCQTCNPGANQNYANPVSSSAPVSADMGNPISGLLICDGCGCTTTDAELAAQLEARPGLISCCPERKMRPATREDWDKLRASKDAAPVSAGKVKALIEQMDAAVIYLDGDDCAGGNLWRELRAALQPGDGWQNGQAAKAMLAHYAQEVRPHAEAKGINREAVREAALASAGKVFDEAWPASLPQGEETR